MMKTIKDYLQEQLYQDLCYTYNQINEVGGLYDGQIELATIILNDIIKDKKKTGTLSKTYKDLTLKNIYFNELIVNTTFWNKTNIKADIDFLGNEESDDPYLKYNYDKKTNRLNTIIITINCPQYADIYAEHIRGRISHELNHGYTYWEILKDDFNEPNIVPKEYHNKLHEWANKIYYKITKKIDNPPNEKAKQICYNLIYSLTRYERNAFLAEIVSYLYDNKGLFKSQDKIQNELKKSPQYNLYVNEGPIIIDLIKNEWLDEDKELLAITYNEIYNTKHSINKIIKILEYKIEETIKKLNKNINILCHIYKDGYNIDENLHYLYFPNKIQTF